MKKPLLRNSCVLFQITGLEGFRIHCQIFSFFLRKKGRRPLKPVLQYYLPPHPPEPSEIDRFLLTSCVTVKASTYVTGFLNSHVVEPEL